MKWEDFESSLSSCYRSLRNGQDFTDVTLACEDGRQVEAHRVILSNSSSFFLGMLKRCQHPHPVIYMRGLNSSTLVALLDFIYQGEVSLEEGGLEEFLKLGQELKLVGLQGRDGRGQDSMDVIDSGGFILQGQDTNESGENFKLNEMADNQNFEKRKTQTSHFQDLQTQSNSFDSSGFRVLLDIPQTTVKQELDQTCTNAIDKDKDFGQTVKPQEKERYERVKPYLLKIGKDPVKYHCKTCGNNSRYIASMANHVESKHLDVSYKCPTCGNNFKCKGSLRKHQHRACGLIQKNMN